MRVSRAADLATQLRVAVAGFAQREHGLLREWARKRHGLTRSFAEAVDGIAAQLASKIGGIESHAGEREVRARAVHEIRERRIRRLREQGLRTLPRRTDEARGNWLGGLQARQMEAEGVQKDARAALDAEGVAARARLEQAANTHADSTRRARQLFGPQAVAMPRSGQEGVPAVIDAPSSAAPSAIPFGAIEENLSALLLDLDGGRRFVLSRLFSFVPLPVVMSLCLLVGLGVALQLHERPGPALAAGLCGISLAVVAFVAHRAGTESARPDAARVAKRLTAVRELLDRAGAMVEQANDLGRLRVEEIFRTTAGEIASAWERADEVAAEFERTAREKLAAQPPRAAARNAAGLARRLATLTGARDREIGRLRDEARISTAQVQARHERDLAELAGEEGVEWQELEHAWEATVPALYAEVREMQGAAADIRPDWTPELAREWTPPPDFPRFAPFGRIEVELSKPVRLMLPGPAGVSVPLALSFPSEGSLVVESSEAGDRFVVDALNNLVLRILTSSPPGKASFTIIDPVGLGERFAGLMHLSDHEGSIINRRIWTQRDQIEDRLGELAGHIEKVIQMFLRNEYATITEYNAQAGSVAEKYHFLVVADFPAGFSEVAAKRLQSILASGPRCGVFTLMHWDRRQPLPDGLTADDLRRSGVWLQSAQGALRLGNQGGALDPLRLEIDAPAPPSVAVTLVQKIGLAGVDADRVEVPFAQVAPGPEAVWTDDTTHELRVAIGRTGATKLQVLAIGRGTRQHALLAGKTGSGKSNLFHVIITNLALACSPDQVEFYLVDFKKGVEFKCYADKRLPHARVVAIESDREFGLSVLERLDEELKRRGDLFRGLGVQDLAGYRRVAAGTPMPRTLLIIDEFQEFFVEDDSIAQAASLLLDRIVRQGRAFGMHVLLGSQTLGGAYTLARATLGQMVIRIALQCNEADAYLIMDDTNAAPRLLTRPGEGIYNDAAGAVEGNSPFQAVWLPEEERDTWLDTVRAVSDAHRDPPPSPVVFEGNAPADIAENQPLAALLNNPPVGIPSAARMWLGAPNSIKGPTEVVFRRQSGSNLLICGQRDETALALVGAGLFCLAAQYPPGSVRFVVAHAVAPGSADDRFLRRMVAATPHPVDLVTPQELPDALAAIAADLRSRVDGQAAAPGTPEVFLFVHGLQRFKKLRQEDEFDFAASAGSTIKPGALVGEILSEGSSVGIHAVFSVDTLNNVNRFLSRRALAEFEMRVVFQMSANDSATLIDTPKAAGLGLHRALLHNEQEGTLEVFRPYALPRDEWIGAASTRLERAAPAVG